MWWYFQIDFLSNSMATNRNSQFRKFFLALPLSIFHLGYPK